MKSQRKIKIVFRKLGRERIFGQAFSDEQLIEIDINQNSRQMLDTIIHEALHLLEPDFSESKVARHARTLSKLLWENNFRRLSK